MVVREGPPATVTRDWGEPGRAGGHTAGHALRALRGRGALSRSSGSGAPRSAVKSRRLAQADAPPQAPAQRAAAPSRNGRASQGRGGKAAGPSRLPPALDAAPDPAPVP